MEMENGKLDLNDEDLTEIFSLFSSPTGYERDQIYQRDSHHYFEKVNLLEEYQLCGDKLPSELSAIRK